MNPWREISNAPKDRMIWVYLPPREGLPGFETHCQWHPDAGFCACEIRIVTLWKEIE